MDAAEPQKRLGSTEIEESARLSADAAAFLLENQKGLRMHKIMLTFKSSGGTLEDYLLNSNAFSDFNEPAHQPWVVERTEGRVCAPMHSLRITNITR